MRLLLLRFEDEIWLTRAPVLLASAACRGVPAPGAGGPSVAKNKRGRVPFMVPCLFWSLSDAADGGARQQGHHGSRRSCWMARYHAAACPMNS
jgi:hypothetical protein